MVGKHPGRRSSPVSAVASQPGRRVPKRGRPGNGGDGPDQLERLESTGLGRPCRLSRHARRAVRRRRRPWPRAGSCKAGVCQLRRAGPVCRSRHRHAMAGRPAGRHHHQGTPNHAPAGPPRPGCLTRLFRVLRRWALRGSKPLLILAPSSSNQTPTGVRPARGPSPGGRDSQSRCRRPPFVSPTIIWSGTCLDAVEPETPDRPSPRPTCHQYHQTHRHHHRRRQQGLLWVGPDDRGLELEVVAVVLSELYLVIPVMPTSLKGGT